VSVNGLKLTIFSVFFTKLLFIFIKNNGILKIEDIPVLLIFNYFFSSFSSPKRLTGAKYYIMISTIDAAKPR
jgi:hypothetical protein